MRLDNISLITFSIIFVLFFSGCNNKCVPVEEVYNTFEYEGCSIKYVEGHKIDNRFWVKHCEDLSHDTTGFGFYEQFEIFNCLCENNKFEIAKQFFEQNQLERKTRGFLSEGIKYSEMSAEDLCKSNAQVIGMQ